MQYVFQGDLLYDSATGRHLQESYHIDIFSAQFNPSGSSRLLSSIWITRRLLPLVLRFEACWSRGRMSMTPPFLTLHMISLTAFAADVDSVFAESAVAPRGRMVTIFSKYRSGGWTEN
jgi:hypothetical protein